MMAAAARTSLFALQLDDERFAEVLLEIEGVERDVKAVRDAAGIPGVERLAIQVVDAGTFDIALQTS